MKDQILNQLNTPKTLIELSKGQNKQAILKALHELIEQKKVKQFTDYNGINYKSIKVK